LFVLVGVKANSNKVEVWGKPEGRDRKKVKSKSKAIAVTGGGGP
jgi:hypothetical protein